MRSYLMSGARQGMNVSWLAPNGAIRHGKLLAVQGARPYQEVIVAEGLRVISRVMSDVMSVQHTSQSVDQPSAWDTWYSMYRSMGVYFPREVAEARFPALDAAAILVGNARYATLSQKKRWLAKQVEALYELIRGETTQDQAHWFSMLLLMERCLHRFGQSERVSHAENAYPFEYLRESGDIVVKNVIDTDDPDFPVIYTYQIPSLRRCRERMRRISCVSQQQGRADPSFYAMFKGITDSQYLHAQE